MMWKLVVPVLAAVVAVSCGALLGGLNDIDVNDPGMMNALNFAVVEHNRRINSMYLKQVSEVIKAQSQVVSGMKYVITVKMGTTGCRKGDEENVNQVCAVHQDPEKAMPYQCTFTVWSRPWLNDIRVTEKC